MKKIMKEILKRRITTGILLVIMMLSVFFSTSVFAANEAADKTATEEIGVAYRGHVQNQGNMPKPEGTMVAGPEALGTRGQSLRVEGFWIELTGNVPEGANIVYEVHVQNEGWMTSVKNGNFAGTAGESQRVESIKIRLENLPGYDVYYRGHVQNVGDIPQVDGDWGWKKNGEELGTTGSSLRLEELQVKLVKQPDTSTTYDKAGTYGPKTGVEVIENDVVINTPDVILQNLHIKGNLTIGEGVGEGDVTLNNITVDGETYIRGGGKNSIHINGGEYNKITIQQTSSGQVRIVATDAAGLEVVVSEDAKGEDIILEGAFENVQIDAPDVKISTQGETTIKDMVVGENSTGAEITLDKNTTVNKIDLNASVDMKGEGTIEKANVNSDNVTFEQKPVEETVAPEVKVPPVVTPPEPPKPDPTPSNPPAEDQLVKAFNQEKSTDMMVNLLEVHAAAFDLTGYNNLDYLGRLIVGDYLLKKDGFANRSVLQSAITEGIKLAKDDPAARRYIEAATAYSPEISFQENNSLLLDYSNPLLSGTQKSLLNGLYADLLVCLETPLTDGEAFEITVSGTKKRITNKEMPGREILLSKLMGRTLGSADLVENQKSRMTFSVKDISIKTEQYLTLYPCTTRNGDEYCRNFSNAHGIRVTRYWIEDFADGFSMCYKDSKFLLNYGKTYPAAVRQQLDTCSVDLALQLYRPLESGESITVTVNGVDYPINANTVMDDDNKTGIRLSKLMGSAPTKASELSGEQVIGLKSYQLNTPNGIDATAVLCKQDGEIFYTLAGAGTSLYPDWLKTYMDSVSFSSEEENKMTLDYDGNLSPAVSDHLGDYQADVIISFSRGLDEGETLTITAFEKTKSFTPGEIAALGENDSQLRLSKLMGVDASLAKSKVGKDEITFTPSGLNRNIYIYSQAVLVKEDEYIYLDGLSNSLSLFEASFQAYADSIDLQSQENTFMVTYTGNLSADVKSKLTGYYADAMIYIDRPLNEGEEISVSAFGKDIPVTRETFNNVWGTWIRLSDLLGLELDDEQLAVNQKGSFEITVKENSLSEQLNISASAILAKGDDIEYINKSTGMSLLPKGFKAFDESVVLNVAADNKFSVQYNGGLSKTVQDSLAGLYADPLIYIQRELENDESITIRAYDQEVEITRNTMKQFPDGKMGLTDLLDIAPDDSLLAATKTGAVVVEITDYKLNYRNDISIWKGLVKADGTWVYRANEGIGLDLNPDLSDAKAITATTVGTLNSGSNGDYIAVPAETRVSALKAGLTVSDKASVEILASTGGVAVINQDSTDVTSLMVIQVTAEDQTTTEYSVSVLPKVQNGPFVGDATVVLKDGTEQNLDGATGIFFLERYDIIDHLIFEMVNNQNENYQSAPQAVLLGENPVLKISVDGELCEYGKIEYADETKTKIKITPSSEAMATLDKLGYFAFNVPENTITDEAGNPVRSMNGNYISGTLNSPLLKVTDSTEPFVEAIKATVDGTPVNASKNETTGAFELEVAQNSVTSEIRVKMNEPVTVSNGVNILIPGTETAYGEIKTDENDSSVVVITPASTGIGTAGNLGLTTFSIPENLVCDLVDDNSSNIIFPSSINFKGGGLGNKATIFNLNILAPDTEKPTMTALTAILNNNPETEVKATGMPLTLVLNKDTLTTQIVVELNEKVTFKNGAISDEGAVVTMSGGGIPEGTIYGKIYREASVGNQLIIEPNGTNGIAGLTGLFTFKVAADTIFDSSNNGNDETSFVLAVVEPEN